jgi:hypothetical protein
MEINRNKLKKIEIDRKSLLVTGDRSEDAERGNDQKL